MAGSPLQISLKVTGLDQAKSDLQAFASTGKRSFEDLAAEAQAAADSAASTDKALSGVANRVRAMAAEMDPAGAATIRLKSSLTDLDRALAAQIVTTEQHATITGVLRERYDELTSAYTASRDPLTHLTGATKDAAAAHQGLSAQAQSAEHAVRGFVDQMSAGASPVQAFLSHIGELTFAASGQGGLTGALSQVGGLLRGFVTPTTLAVAATATLAVGFGVLIDRAATNNSTLREFNLALGTVGDKSSAAVQSLQAGAQELRSMGVAAADADRAMADLARNPILNPASASDLVKTGADLGARLGVTSADGLKSLTDALAGGVDGINKLAFATKAYGSDEAAALLIEEQHAGTVRATNDAYVALKSGILGAHDQLGPAALAAEKLRGSWDGLLNTLSSGSAFQLAEVNLTKLATDLTNLVTKGQLIDPNTPGGRLVQSIGAAGAGGEFGFVAPTSPGASAAPSPAISSLVAVPAQYAAAIAAAAQQYGIPADLLAGLLASESSFNPAALSPKGAQGIAQFMPDTAAQYGVNASDPMSAIPGAAHYLSDLRAQGGSYQSALTGYVTGNPKSTYQFPASSPYVKTGTLALAQQYDTAGASPVVQDPTKTAASKAALDQYNATANQQLQITSELGTEAKTLSAFWAGYNQELDRSHDPMLATIAGDDAMAASKRQLAVEAQKEITLAGLVNQGEIGIAAAYGASEGAGLRAAAAEQARIEVMEKGGDVTTRTAQILTGWAAAAVSGAAQANAAMVPVIAAQERLASAAANGSAALHDQEVVNEAIARTQDVLTKAIESGNAAYIAAAQAEQAEAIAKARRLDLLKQETALYQDATANDNQVDVLRLETSLQGQTAEYIQAQVSLLEKTQSIRAANVPLTDAAARADLKSLQTLGETNIALADAQRQQARIDDTMRSIGQTIDSSITQNLENAFDGQKITSWGTILHQVLAQAEAQLVSLALVKPAIGTVLSMLGLGNAASSFGTFASLASSGASGAGAGSGGFTLSNAASGASLLNSGSSLFGASGSVTDWLNGIGSNLGFATNLQGPTISGAALGEGSLFGSTTLSGALGGIGAGFTAGSLLNSVLGGNQVGGMIGSGVGSLAGAAIGSIIPGVGTLIGGLIGGAAGGGLGGLFGGNPHPESQAAGLIFNPATGAMTSQVSGSDQNNQALQTLATSLANFSQQLQSLTGGIVGGSLNPQVTNQGTRIGYDFGNGVAGTVSASDPTSALNQVEQLLVSNIGNLSGTLATVVSHITDPSQLQAAVQFATAYDSIKTAADDAFKSVNDTTGQIGPFATAMSQIQTVFGGLTTQATQFGLSLDPINAALAEATTRLQGDFGTSLDQALNTASGMDVVNQLEGYATARQTNLSDAWSIGLGGDQATIDKISGIYGSQVNSALSGLSDSQLSTIAAGIAGLDPAVSTLAQTLLTQNQAAEAAQAAAASAAAQAAAAAVQATAIQDAATAATEANTAAQEAQTQALQQLQQERAQIQSWLDGELLGPSSTLSPADQLTAAQQQFSTALSGTDVSAATSAADSLLSAAKDYYATSPGYAATESMVRSQITSFGASLTGFATGGSFTIGGAGGTDSQIVAFRATPGEQVSISTPNGGVNAASGFVKAFASVSAAQGNTNALLSSLLDEMQALRASFDAMTREFAMFRQQKKAYGAAA